MIGVGLLLLVLAAVPFALATMNLRLLRVTPHCAPQGDVLVSILIPARNEAKNIGAALDTALGSRDVPFEILVMDDGSTDGTAAIVRMYEIRDPRVRLLTAPPLKEGWTGKIHACHHLSEAARGTHFLFVDADVRLAPEAAARLTGHAQATASSLVSAVPRQIMHTLGELLTVPMINFLMLGYLPMSLMRLSREPGFGVACGQLMLAERDAYRFCGGHAAIRTLIHDGIQIARLFRRKGFMTDLLPGDRLATCRMYDTFDAAWAGFAKNAHEGMATPGALPVWTVLLLGGHVLPFLMLPLVPTLPIVCAALLSLLTRLLVTATTRENALSVMLHPFTILVGLAIQWSVLLRIGHGRRTGWKGRLYALQGEP
jgi:hypothetical protein